MSIRKSLKWICRRCLEKADPKPEIDKTTEILKPCDFCPDKTVNWCFLVESSRQTKPGVAGKKADLVVIDDVQVEEAPVETPTEEIEEAPEAEGESAGKPEHNEASATVGEEIEANADPGMDVENYTDLDKPSKKQRKAQLLKELAELE